MTFISYSQNHEDVLLWRALGHIANGFYIDVGANDPELHSVTKAFYDAGWRGINVEPMPSYRQPFLDQRPRDINLACAAGAEEGEITLYDVPDMNGWASTDAAVASAHAADGYAVTEVKVPLRTLSGICAEHVQGPIHFLKIDVEGFEGAVLQGMDFQRWRPWVLVIEATLPGQRTTNHGDWEHLVLPHGYRYAYFDGLNRYYVAEEHPALLEALNLQPNVFDAFIPHHLDKAWKQEKQLAAEVRANWQRIDELDAHAGKLTADLQRRAQENARQASQLEELQQQALRMVEHLQQTQDQLQETIQRELAALQREQAALQREQAANQREQTTYASLLRADEWGRNLEQRLNAVYASSSWRITAPLRLVMRRGPDSLPNLVRRKAKGALRRGLRWLTSREALRRTLLPVIGRSPWLQQQVANTLAAAKMATAPDSAATPDVPSQLRDLSIPARAVLADLQRAFDTQAK